MLAKINKLKNWQVALIIVILGFAIFSTGLTSPFHGDDIFQIVTALPVHSITNIRLFFEGGTIYTGHGLAPLSGTYFRPLMTTIYSLIYSLFGARPVAFHIVQLALYVGSASLLYLIFKYSFKTVMALILAIIFLIHPLNSQVVYAIQYMQDALFFFFGILAIWLLLRFKSIRSLWLVALCLFLSLLSKETAVVFIIMALLYLFWFNRDRFYKFIYIMVVPVAAYLALRINAVGTTVYSNVAPIDHLNLLDRLLTMPSIVLFYITKFVFPWKLATAYYWTYSSFSVRHVLLPLANYSY
jgi:4-amino-4-deoxy-L-arabinose transferase-like glycosyltransferase